jgi:TPP-dependent pyruvate/acetoin dehydrogenase alpha subunit
MTIVNEALARRESLKASPKERLSRMLEIRYFEDRVRELFAEGMVIGTTHTVQGQEAVSIGISMAAQPTDMVAATYRSHGIALALGMSPLSVMAEILGRTAGSVGGVGGSMHLCDISVGLLPTMAIVGAGIPIAAGAALTAQVRGTSDAAIAIFGDGASNIGAFHEGINLAAIWNLPVVFVCENNLYGEYSPISTTTSVEDIAARAASYGIPGVIVDGQDVDVVYGAVNDALTRVRSGAGPILLEMKTYRFAGHSRADTGPYRPEGELDLWLQRDPIDIYANRLIENGTMTQADVDSLREEARLRIEETVQQSLASPVPGVSAMFTNIYASQ